MADWLNRCHIGDVRDTLRAMAAEGVKVQCVITSPPYWGLRDYGVDGQIGLEPTPEAYVATMVEVFRRVREVLAEDGTLWLNIGDSYASGSHKGGVDTSDEFISGGCASWSTRDSYKASTLATGLKIKDLIGIPWRIAFALQADGWYLRSDIIWHKPNPMPESVTDRPTKAHEYVFLLSKNAKYYYDADAIREEYATPPELRGSKHGHLAMRGQESIRPRGNLEACDDPSQRYYSRGGRNRRSVWTIATQAYSEAHFATFPGKLVEPCILAGTSQKGHCPGCGGRWRRVVERGELMPTRAKHDKRAYGVVVATPDPGDQGRNRARDGHRAHMAYEAKTIGWQPACACALDPVPDIVLDPFLGSGTVAQVAQNLGRQWIGIDLNPQYAPMQQARTAQQGLRL